MLLAILHAVLYAILYYQLAVNWFLISARIFLRIVCNRFTMSINTIQLLLGFHKTSTFKAGVKRGQDTAVALMHNLIKHSLLASSDIT